MLANVFDAFIEQSPLSVMMRALMEQVLAPHRLDAIFAAHAERQY